jgi:hypothetical protein
LACSACHPPWPTSHGWPTRSAEDPESEARTTQTTLSLLSPPSLPG